MSFTGKVTAVTNWAHKFFISGFVGKTLYDWMTLLFVPAVLSGGVIWFNLIELSSEDRRAKIELEVNTARAQDVAMEAYVDHMATWLLENELRSAKPEDTELRAVARTSTLTVLRQLDGPRKGRLVRFLYEAGLIGFMDVSRDTTTPAVIELKGADLTEAVLSQANLVGVDFSFSNLESADLRGANLSEAFLRKAYLVKADLRMAKLHEADLTEANLIGARVSDELDDAASLEGARLPNRADLP